MSRPHSDPTTRPLDARQRRRSRPGWLPLMALGLLAACGASSVARDGAAGDRAAAPGADLAHAAAWTAETKVGAIVAASPATARLFELVEIDYCCGGEVTLAEAAEAAGVAPAKLLAALATVGAAAQGAHEPDWRRAPLAELADHIVDTHHAYLWRELPRLAGIVATVERVHGSAHSELAEVAREFRALAADIGPHLELEERDVFPVARDLGRATPEALSSAVATLRADHERVGAALGRLRALTGDYALPADACALYTELLSGLEALERDLHTHVHLENEVLLPRLVAAR